MHSLCTLETKFSMLSKLALEKIKHVFCGIASKLEQSCLCCIFFRLQQTLTWTACWCVACHFLISSIDTFPCVASHTMKWCTCELWTQGGSFVADVQMRAVNSSLNKHDWRHSYEIETQWFPWSSRSRFGWQISTFRQLILHDSMHRLQERKTECVTERFGGATADHKRQEKLSFCVATPNHHTCQWTAKRWRAEVIWKRTLKKQGVRVWMFSVAKIKN